MVMIVVKVERWENGDAPEGEEIARMTLTPTRPESEETGDYMYVLDEGVHPLGMRPLRDRGRITGHPRRQTVWALVGRAITEAIFRRTTH